MSVGRIHTVDALGFPSGTWVFARRLIADIIRTTPATTAAIATGSSHGCQCRRDVHSTEFRIQGADSKVPRLMNHSRQTTKASAGRPPAMQPDRKSRGEGKGVT